MKILKRFLINRLLKDKIRETPQSLIFSLDYNGKTLDILVDKKNKNIRINNIIINEEILLFILKAMQK